eukprot:6444333-Alexandrium_andersonii.AAC.1
MGSNHWFPALPAVSCASPAGDRPPVPPLLPEGGLSPRVLPSVAVSSRRSGTAKVVGSALRRAGCRAHAPCFSRLCH